MTAEKPRLSLACFRRDGGQRKASVGMVGGATVFLRHKAQSWSVAACGGGGGSSGEGELAGTGGQI